MNRQETMENPLGAEAFFSNNEINNLSQNDNPDNIEEEP